ncbi:uncharacterized protein LOC143301387 [Babylonia areolata]|uniref:uncharacterized protein LOC143301387 n=1 Tax=Babylonia areolata TaxID=304850 RepID=UPI003FD1615C
MATPAGMLVLLFLALGMQVILISHVGCLPSSRVVYYLHARAATWNEASFTCASYGAVLFTLPEFESAKNRLHYVDSTVWNHALESLTQGFWAGLYMNSTGQLRWQKCTDYNSMETFPVVSTGGGGAAGASPPSCYVSSPDLTLSALSCDVRRPYVCQRDDGQCWFQPYIDSDIQDSHATDGHVNDSNTAEDEAECAKLCRSSVDQEGRECWAFTFQYPPGVCRLHSSEVSHKYANLAGTSGYFHPAEDTTTYVKICTGGWVTTLEAATTDRSATAKDENCTITTADEWDNSVCYCECDQPPIILEAETLVMTIEEKVDKIVKELQVNPQNTSSTRRKKISVEDSRPSAQGIGFFGVGFLICIFGGIFLMDLNVLYVHVAKLCKSMKAQSSQSDA